MVTKYIRTFLTLKLAIFKLLKVLEGINLSPIVYLKGGLRSTRNLSIVVVKYKSCELIHNLDT